MSRRSLVLFDDAHARDWRPFSLTRPVGELLFGTATLRARAERTLDATCSGHIAGPHLRSYDEPWAPPVLDPALGPTDGPRVLLCSRFAAETSTLPGASALLVADGRVVGCSLEAGAPPPDPAFFTDPDHHAPDLPPHEIRGSLLESPWSLVTRNAERTAADLHDAGHSALPAHVHHVGPGPVSVGTGVEISPGVVLDTRDGPIRIEDGVTIRPFTRLVGPSFVGAGTTLLGGPFEAVSIGPVCKVHGEVEESVFLGYGNKAHDGFLGHSCVGMWVNLGALTTNSDLKNNYGTVRVWTPRGETDTGQTKVGCFLGDHAKTAIGTMLNTGTVVGAGANIFNGRPGKYVPPFTWGDPDTPYELDRFLDTARTVMGRRDVTMSDDQADLLRAAWRTARDRSDRR